METLLYSLAGNDFGVVAGVVVIAVFTVVTAVAWWRRT
jgi:hypothetical protein